MLKAMNTTHGTSFEADTFEEVFAWGVSNLPGPTISLDDCSAYKAELERNGRTAFDDTQGCCYAETIEIWDTVKLGSEYPGEE